MYHSPVGDTFLVDACLIHEILKPTTDKSCFQHNDDKNNPPLPIKLPLLGASPVPFFCDLLPVSNKTHDLLKDITLRLMCQADTGLITRPHPWVFKGKRKLLVVNLERPSVGPISITSSLRRCHYCNPGPVYFPASSVHIKSTLSCVWYLVYCYTAGARPGLPLHST